MPEVLEKWINIARAYLGQFSTRKKVVAGSIGLLILIAAIGVISLSNRDPYKMLYSDLESSEARQVIKKLGELRIPYLTSNDQTSISVPESRVDDVRMELAKEGLPGQDIVGFEKFDGSTLGMSSYVQRIQYVRAVQGELVRSIERLSAVKAARVHISIPPKKTFLEDEDPPKASVVLELSKNLTPSKSETLGIAHLVASAVEGLTVSNISIVDTRGKFLHRPGQDELSGAPTKIMEYRKQMEGDFERRVEEILNPVVGLGRVRARVSVEIDPSRVNSTEEKFDPDRTAVRSNIRNEETSGGSKPNPVGIPGSRSNLPGAEVENPPVPVAQMNKEKVQQNQNFAVPRTITVTNKPEGGIQRLTVAVVVDGKNAPGAAFEPRTEEELMSLRDLVANSIGFDEGRRDSITISSMPFTNTVIAEPISPVSLPWWSTDELSRHLIRNLLIAGLILCFFFFVLRPYLKWSSAGDLVAEFESLPKTVAELELGGSAGDVLALSEAKPILGDEEPLDKREEKELRERILEKLEEVPKKGTRIVQDWIDEGTSYTPLKA